MDRVHKSVLKDIHKYSKRWFIISIITTILAVLVCFFSMKEYAKIANYLKVDAEMLVAYDEPITANGKANSKHITKFSYVIDGEKYESKVEGINFNLDKNFIYVNPSNYKDVYFENNLNYLRDLPSIIFLLDFAFIVLMVVCSVIYFYHVHLKRKRNREKRAKKKALKAGV